jgi:hypothetical protein
MDVRVLLDSQSNTEGEQMNPTCDRCGEQNPADIHTCTPKPAPVQEPVACLTVFRSLSGDRNTKFLELSSLPEGEHYFHTTQPEQPAPCTWTKSADPHMPDTFHSTCGVVWTFTDGGPGENNVHFCPKCGNKAVESQP